MSWIVISKNGLRYLKHDMRGSYRFGYDWTASRAEAARFSQEHAKNLALNWDGLPEPDTRPVKTPIQ